MKTRQKFLFTSAVQGTLKDQRKQKSVGIDDNYSIMLTDNSRKVIRLSDQ